MMEWVFGSLVLVSALIAAFAGHMRHAILALGSMGLGLGGIFFLEGVPYLGICQWIVSTLLIIALVFSGLLFGKWGDQEKSARSKKGIAWIPPLLAGVAIGILIWTGIAEVLNKISPGPLEKAESTVSLSVFGKWLTGDYFLSFEIFGLLVLFALVGAGLISRLEEK